MRTATALGWCLFVCVSAAAQVPSPIEGPLTSNNTTPQQIQDLFNAGQLRHADGSLPHEGDSAAAGPDCLNGAAQQVWHWHRIDLDSNLACGHGAVILAEGGGGGVPEVFAPGFEFGEVLDAGSRYSDRCFPTILTASVA